MIENNQNNENDHNLDDLIMEDIPTKSSTGKNILTILGLLIIILFVAIFLMKTLLNIAPSTQEHNLTFEQNTSEKVDDELTLSNIVTLPSPQKVNSNLSDIVDEESTQPKAPQTLTEDNSTQIPQDNTVKEEEPLVEDEENISRQSNNPIKDEKTKENSSQENISLPLVTKTKNTAVQKEKEIQVKRTPIRKTVHTKVKEKKKSVKKVKKQNHNVQYYIQVGSYRKHPSTEFLAIIRKTGFRYKVTPTNSRGIRQLLIGAYSSRHSAENALKQVQDRINKKAFVVKR